MKASVRGSVGPAAAHLHGVHRDVDAAVQQCIVDLLREEALAADIRQRLVQDLVAGRLDDADLEGAFQSQLRVLRLRAIGLSLQGICNRRSYRTPKRERKRILILRGISAYCPP